MSNVILNEMNVIFTSSLLGAISFHYLKRPSRHEMRDIFK